jgi:hypothetical protein
LEVLDNVTQGSLHGGTVSIHIDPNGNDTWKFDYFLDLGFSDHSHLVSNVRGVVLDQDHQDTTSTIS